MTLGRGRFVVGVSGVGVWGSAARTRLAGKILVPSATFACGIFEVRKGGHHRRRQAWITLWHIRCAGSRVSSRHSCCNPQTLGGPLKRCDFAAEVLKFCLTPEPEPSLWAGNPHCILLARSPRVECAWRCSDIVMRGSLSAMTAAMMLAY